MWHLSDSLADATTNANHGVNTGSVAANGAVAGGRACDGNDFIDCGNGASLNLSSNRLTLSAWIRPNAITGNAIISKSYAATHTSPYYAWVLYTTGSGLHCRLDTTAATKGTLTLGAWQHVAVTYNGSAITYYIDGAPVGTVAKTGNLLSTARNVRIGGRDTSPLEEYFNGGIDEVRISSVARSADWLRAERDTVADAAFCTFGPVEDISRPLLSVADASCAEGDAGTAGLLFRVTLSYALSEPVSFHYATSNATATSAEDYQAHEGACILAAGQTEGVIAVPVNGDRTAEPDEFFCLRVSAVTNAFLAREVAYGLILDDDRTNRLAPCALAADTTRGRLYVARHADASVGVIDASAGRLIQAYALDAAPNGLALSPDGARLYAACGGLGGQVTVLDAASGALLGTVAAGHTPLSPVVSPDGATLYLCNRFDNDVSLIRVADGATLARIAVGREPHAAALTPDGSKLFVAELLPTGTATNPAVAAAVSVIDTATRTVTRRIPLPPGAQSLRGLCLSADGATVYGVHVLSRFYAPTTQVLRGWMNTAALSVIDAASESYVSTVLLDDLDLGAANPWGVVCTADNRYVCVSHAGTHEVSVIDQAALRVKLLAADEDTPQDLTFLVGLRRRLPLKGNGPRGLAAVGGTLFAAEYFSDTVGAVSLAPGSEYGASEIALGAPRPSDPAGLGERHFNDATLCLQNWQSCASCHPDARADALNWDLINDGFGSPKNTKSMLFAMQTPPAMSTGIRAHARVAVRAGLKYIQFVSQPESLAVEIDTYLAALRPVPSPHLAGGSLSAAAVRGAAHFQARGCAACHSGEYLTDGQLHDIGTATAQEAGLRFDTPTLFELWRTAPYLHDGRFASVRDVVTTAHASRVSGLTPEEIDDLVEYLLSL